MFCLDVTMEDWRIIAREVEPIKGEVSGFVHCLVQFVDNHSGMIDTRRMKMLDVVRIVSVAMTQDGETTVTTTYEDALKLIEGVLPECRPLP